MVHANIVETRRPEVLGECARLLSQADKDYFRRRADEEAEAADAAYCCEARMAHEELASAYRLLCSTRNGAADRHLAPELNIFQFRPEPVG
jgi:hypothetical protein